METLTAQQAKQVIAYFGEQAAEDMPAGEHQGDFEWDRQAFLTWLQTCIAIERRITEHDWYAVLVSFMDLQSFDRDPAGYLYERGYSDIYKTRTMTRWTLQDLVSWAIDNAYHNSLSA